MPKARENAGNQVVSAFCFKSDWLREWCEFLLDQSQRSKAKPMQSQMTFDKLLHPELLSFFQLLTTVTVLFCRLSLICRCCPSIKSLFRIAQRKESKNDFLLT